MRTSVGLDIGWRAIKLVQLEKTPKGIRLAKAGLHFLPYQEKETEANRIEAIKKGITQLMAELKIPSRHPLNLAVSGQSVFIRSIQVIAVSQEKLKQHIRFEAEQQIPFALNEVLWDHSVLNPEKKPSDAMRKETGQWRVVLAAIKKNLVDRQLETVKLVKGKCHLVDVGPMAVYNSTFFSSPEFFKQSVLLLDIGAKGTNLVIANQGDVWIRSFPIGSDKLTQTIADTVRLSFNEAEVFKQRVGLEPSSDPGERQVSSAMMPGLNDLLEEIQRSIEYYQAQVVGASKQVKLEKVILSGGGALLRGLAGLFQERLKIPVELWSGFQKIATKTPFIGTQTSFATAMGLALRWLATMPVELNLLHEQVERQWQKRTLQFYGTGSLMLLLAILAIALQTNRSTYYRKANYLEELKKTIKTYQTYEPQIKELELKNESLKNRVKFLHRILRQRQVPLEVFQSLGKFLPKEVWLQGYEGNLDILSTISDTTRGIIRIVGQSLSYQGVTEFVTSLKNSVQFTQVKPVSSNIKRLESSEEVVEFQLEMKVAW